MTFKNWAWDFFETSGNIDAFLAVKEYERQEQLKKFGNVEFGSINNQELKIEKDNIMEDKK